MRLDQLLSHESDVQALVAEHLDVRALFRLRKCSRKLGKELSSERVVRASIQHSFPGVTTFIAGHTFGFYENILSRYCSESPDIGDEFKFHENMDSLLRIYQPSSEMSSAEFEIELHRCWYTSRYLQRTEKGRALMLERIQGWKNQLRLYPKLFNRRLAPMLDYVKEHTESAHHLRFFFSDAPYYPWM